MHGRRLPEIDAIGWAEVSRIKANSHQRPVPPALQLLHRGCPAPARLAGTVNSGDTYLHDETGNRRFWTKRCVTIDIDVFVHNRDQFWVEAERANREMKRSTDAVGISLIDRVIIRLVGAIMLETNDKWSVARRYMSLETLARFTDNPNSGLPALAF